MYKARIIGSRIHAHLALLPINDSGRSTPSLSGDAERFFLDYTFAAGLTVIV